jgi:hypothetical protein
LENISWQEEREGMDEDMGDIARQEEGACVVAEEVLHCSKKRLFLFYWNILE